MINSAFVILITLSFSCFCFCSDLSSNQLKQLPSGVFNQSIMLSELWAECLFHLLGNPIDFYVVMNALNVESVTSDFHMIAAVPSFVLKGNLKLISQIFENCSYALNSLFGRSILFPHSSTSRHSFHFRTKGCVKCANAETMIYAFLSSSKYGWGD